jgi:L-lactate dehydrogenase complex protein LldG
MIERPPRASLIERFSSEARDAGAVVQGPVTPEAVCGLVRQIAEGAGSLRVLAWRDDALGVSNAWRGLEALGLQLECPALPADPAARHAALAAMDDARVGLTGVIGAFADTGTLVVASGTGRPRLAWLLPDRHIAFVDTARIYADKRAFLDDARTAAALDAAHVAFVTGPSRTADIELTMTRGVHGPRELHIVLIDGTRD